MAKRNEVTSVELETFADQVEDLRHEAHDIAERLTKMIASSAAFEAPAGTALRLISGSANIAEVARQLMVRLAMDEDRAALETRFRKGAA